MRKLLVIVAVLAAALLPAAAHAAGPPFENLSPRNGAYVTVSYTGVKVEFSCPDYYEASPYGGEYERDWSDYEVVLSPRPFVGEFGGLVVYRTVLPGALETCSMNIPSYKVEPAGTYYWRVRRPNREVIGGYEFGAPTSFTTATQATAPTVPTTPAAPPPPSGGARAQVSVWTGCGLSSHTPRSSRCPIGGPMGAFIESSTEVTYKICVRFPEGEGLCTNRPQYAEAATTYVNKITGHTPGRYVVTWIVEGHRYKRTLRRVYG